MSIEIPMTSSGIKPTTFWSETGEKMGIHWYSTTGT
jgi:hypothetical protein